MFTANASEHGANQTYLTIEPFILRSMYGNIFPLKTLGTLFTLFPAHFSEDSNIVKHRMMLIPVGVVHVPSLSLQILHHLPLLISLMWQCTQE